MFLGLLGLPVYCVLSSIVNTITTFVVAFSWFSDVWTVAVFGVNGYTLIMGISVIWMAMSSLCLAVVYAVMSRDKKASARDRYKN